MWKKTNATLPSVLIVENKKGDVFIVENEEFRPQIEKILNTKQAKSAELSGENVCDADSFIFNFRDEDNEDEDDNTEKEQHDDEGENEDDRISGSEEQDIMVPTICISSSSDEGDVSVEQVGKASRKSIRLKEKQKTKLKLGSRKNWKHKKRNLTGTNSCKYCETFFKSAEEKTLHACKFLECGPKNFICRICNKELSQKTFSNHLHETLNCPCCDKKFVNPRCMKTHIKQQHKNFNFLEPKTKSEEANIGVVKKKAKFECDFCGRYLATRQSMALHLNLHIGKASYMCENCGEKFFSPSGIKGHSCVKKRRRPQKDFRTYESRYCRFCDKNFKNFDENKAHTCRYEHPDNPKLVLCRTCQKVLTKSVFNRHMESHTGDWVCRLCHKTFRSEKNLVLHMQTHNKLFKCDSCSKVLSTEKSLNNHKQRLHNTTVRCELCKEEFNTRELLNLHLQIAHEPSVCKFCYKSFALPRYLKMHEKLHANDEKLGLWQYANLWKNEKPLPTV